MMGKSHIARWKRLCGLVLAFQLVFHSTTYANVNTPIGFEGLAFVRQMRSAFATAGVTTLGAVTPIIKLQAGSAFTTMRTLFKAEKEAFKVSEVLSITKQRWNHGIFSFLWTGFIPTIKLLSGSIGTILGTTVKGANMFIEGPFMGFAKNYFLGNPDKWIFLIVDQAVTLASNLWKDWGTPQQDPWANVFEQGHQTVLDAFFVVSCGTCFWGTKFLNPLLSPRFHRTFGWKESLGMMGDYLFVSRTLSIVSNGTALGDFYDKVSSLKKLPTAAGFMAQWKPLPALRESIPTLGFGFSKIAMYHLLDGDGINGSHWVNTTKEWEKIRNTTFDHGVAMVPGVGPLFVLWETVSWIQTYVAKHEGAKEIIPQRVQRIWSLYEECREWMILRIEGVVRFCLAA